jgi:transposase
MTKGKISKFFVQYLPKYFRGRKTKVGIWRIVKAILYKLKTGVQWKELPMTMFFGDIKYSYQSVYYHFNKWSQTGVWERLYIELIKGNKTKLDMSIVNLDGTHTTAKRGGQRVGYQGRKRAKTTNILIVADKNGLVVGWSPPISGEHHDSYELKKTAQKIFDNMQSNGLSCDGLFLNADAGFDVKEFKQMCESRGIIPNVDKNVRRRQTDSEDQTYIFDNELYKNRFTIEQLNAWIDGYRTLLIRHEVKMSNWLSFHCLAFASIFIRKSFMLTSYF